MIRYTQVKNLGTLELLRNHLRSLGLELAVDDEVDPAGALATPVTFTDGSAGGFTVPNRFAALPMEGWDAGTDGRPTDLVRRRWQRFGTSGCGLVWGEATAIVPEGRANPNQLVIDASTTDDIAGLRELLAPDQVAGLQLTHSGRWSRPEGTPAPRTGVRDAVLDARVGAGDAALLSDAELDALSGRYVSAAALARRAGFDFVDVKCCHGYLLHELLGGRNRGVDFVRRTIGGIRDAVPDLAVAVRLSIFDFVPYAAGPDGAGVPDAIAGNRRPFGADDTGVGIDLTETHAFVELLGEFGVGLVCTTAGSPYYNPHIQRPAYFPPSDGYQPPEDPLVGVARQLRATAEMTRAHPGITFIGSGYSYLQDWLPNVAQPAVAAGGVDLVGLGRMMLSYPSLPADVLASRPLDRRHICRTFSDCTTAPRNGLVSGCYPLDEFYKGRDERVALVKAKRALRESQR